MYSVSGKKPGDSVQACITLTYTGTLAADVKVYTASTIGSLGQYLDMTVDKGSGSPTFPGCTGFILQSNIFTGTLQSFASATMPMTLPSAAAKIISSGISVFFIQN